MATMRTAPPPAPDRLDPTTFAAKSAAWVDWDNADVALCNTQVTETNANVLVAMGYRNDANNSANASALSAIDSSGFATASGVSATASSGFATAAAASAATAFNAPATSATSTTSNAVGLGTKSFTTQTGKNFNQFQFLIIAKDNANYMVAQIQSYNSGTGAIVVNALAYVGAGTYTAWSIALSAPLVKTTVGVVADGTALSAVLVPSTNDTSVVNGYGYYRFDSGFTGTADGETAILAADGTVGAWICESISPDMLLAILADDLDNIYNRLGVLEGGADGLPLNLTAFLPAVLLPAAGGSITFSVPFPAADFGDTVAINPVGFKPTGTVTEGWFNARTEIRSKGVVSVILINVNTSNAFTTISGNWAIRIFKKS